MLPGLVPKVVTHKPPMSWAGKYSDDKDKYQAVYVWYVSYYCTVLWCYDLMVIKLYLICMSVGLYNCIISLMGINQVQ